jgi:hypothetical protein
MNNRANVIIKCAILAVVIVFCCAYLIRSTAILTTEITAECITGNQSSKTTLTYSWNWNDKPPAGNPVVILKWRGVDKSGQYTSYASANDLKAEAEYISSYGDIIKAEIKPQEYHEVIGYKNAENNENYVVVCFDRYLKDKNGAFYYMRSGSISVTIQHINRIEDSPLYYHCYANYAHRSFIGKLSKNKDVRHVFTNSSKSKSLGDIEALVYADGKVELLNN